VVTGDPVTVINDGKESATDVTPVLFTVIDPLPLEMLIPVPPVSVAGVYMLPVVPIKT
jgi:hypothetical protein